MEVSAVIASEARSDTRGNPQIESTAVSAACSVCALMEGIASVD